MSANYNNNINNNSSSNNNNSGSLHSGASEEFLSSLSPGGSSSSTTPPPSPPSSTATPSPGDRKTTGVKFSVSAPGKVILFGEHSVVYGKLALAASLGLRTKLTLVELEPDKARSNGITINLQALNLLHSYNINEIKKHLLDNQLPLVKNSAHFDLEHPEHIDHDRLLQRVGDFVAWNSGSKPLNYFQKIALTSLFYLFAGIFGSPNLDLKPFDLEIRTELSIGAGTGSSASYLVTLAAAFLRYAELRLRRDGGAARNGYRSPRSFSLFGRSGGRRSDDRDVGEGKKEEGEGWRFGEKELELISKWAYSAEKIIHGSASGIDNTICTFGSMVEFRKGVTPKLVALGHKFRILLVNTGVARDTKTLVGRVVRLREKHSTVVDRIFDAMNSAAENALDCIAKINSADGGGSAPLDGEAFGLRGHYERLGELTRLNQNLLRALDVSHPKLDLICSILEESGLNGKLTGAGGGGYAISIVPPHHDERALGDVVAALNAQGFQAVVTDLGGAGVAVE